MPTMKHRGATVTGPPGPPGQRGKRWKGADLLFLALAIGASGASLVFAAQGTAGRATLVAESPAGSYLYSLDEDAVVNIPGTLGDSALEIRGGAARFVDSPCENKLCVAHRPLSRSGDWSACLPNRVIIRVEGLPEEKGLDATAH
jgi:hypothetical protein